jgi:hypothetical protein
MASDGVPVICGLSFCFANGSHDFSLEAVFIYLLVSKQRISIRINQLFD